jgi:hypothetical protein
VKHILYNGTGGIVYEDHILESSRRDYDTIRNDPTYSTLYTLTDIAQRYDDYDKIVAYIKNNTNDIEVLVNRIKNLNGNLASEFKWVLLLFEEE